MVEDFLISKWQIQKIGEAIEDLKKRDPFMAAELDFHPDNFDVDEETFEIARKQNAPPPKPNKIWDEVHGRWVTRLGKLVTRYDNNI